RCHDHAVLLPGGIRCYPGECHIRHRPRQQLPGPDPRGQRWDLGSVMQHVESAHSPGTVVIPAASLARYNEFWMSVESLQVPHGTKLVAARGADIPHQLNEGIRRMTGEWVWILGDDHVFVPDLLLKLLDRGKDVILPLTPRREHPFYPCMLHG